MTHALDAQYPIEIPVLVARAKAVAVELGFDLRADGNRAGSQPNTPSCCIDEVGSLLMVLAATITTGKIGEIGTGAGVGTAWMISGANSIVDLYTAEIDPELCQATTRLFEQHHNVHVLNEDWRSSFSDEGPFNLVFADGGGITAEGASRGDWEAVANLLVTGGIMVIDDLTPEHLWPDTWKGKPDPKRELAFNSGLFFSTEVLSRADISTLIMVKK